MKDSSMARQYFSPERITKTVLTIGRHAINQFIFEDLEAFNYKGGREEEMHTQALFIWCCLSCCTGCLAFCKGVIIKVEKMIIFTLWQWWLNDPFRSNADTSTELLTVTRIPQTISSTTNQPL